MCRKWIYGNRDLRIMLLVHLLKGIKRFKETVDSRYIYQSKLDETCSQHDMAYGDFKELNRRTAADRVLHDEAFGITLNPKYDGYQQGQ